MKKDCYVFDIDGTISDVTHRLPHIQGEMKNWDAFFAACVDDPPIAEFCDLARSLCASAPILFVSGRSDQVRAETDFWLKVKAQLLPSGLYMRAAGDHRPDHQVKSELMDKLMEDGWRPLMIFEDRNQVVEMWRKRGLPCCQVADGNF